MPLPLALVAIPVVLGLLGAKKGYDAYSNHSKAKDLNREAQDTFDKAQKRLKDARSQCTKELKTLGQLKLDVWNRQLGRFVSLFGQLRNVELVGAAEVDQLGTATFQKEDLAKMKKVSDLATEVVSGGAAAIGSGALVGMASYGGATMLATASTGTAISSLSGVAATNATLAWFGGGSLAAGGAGMAGGVAVLGGFVAGPVLAVGGMVLAAKTRRNLAAARTNYAEAEKIASECDAAASVVNGIRKVAEQFQDMIANLDQRTTPILDDLAALIEKNCTTFSCWRPWTWWPRRPNYSKFTEDERRKVHLAVMFAQGFKIVLDTPILTKEGALAKTGPKKALQQGERLLSTEV